MKLSLRQCGGYLFKAGIAVVVMAVLGLPFLDAQLREKFEGKRWKIPAKVYASPMDLYVGAGLTQQDVIDEIERLHYRRISAIGDEPGSYAVVGSRVDLVTRGFNFWDGKEPSRRVTILFRNGQVKMLSSGGQSVALIRLEPFQIGGIYGADKEDRLLVQLAHVPDQFVQTLLAVEDRLFYQHSGLSLRGIARAAWVNIKEGGWVQGGSTLTQQLVKNFYLNNERTLSRKLLEAVMALLLEVHYSKEEVLEAYLNEVYLGQQGSWAIHGVGLASQYYFGQPLAGLKPEQMALLVAIIKGPSYYNPIRNPERARARRNQVLQMMVEAGVIEAQQLNVLRASPLGLVSDQGRSTNQYPGFMSLVKRQLSETYASEDLQSEGLRIFTTLDPRVQAAAERALQEGVRALEQKGKGKGGALQGGLIVTAPDNGEVLALVGDKNPRYAGFNRVLDAKRQVGSIIKPAVFLAALEDRERYQLTSLVDDVTFSISLPSGGDWQPKNFDGQSHGPVLMVDALAYSYNQATAQLAMEVGLDRVIDVLRRLGVQQTLPVVPAISLGAVELTPMEVAKVYQTIAADGFSSPIQAIREILDGKGQPLKRYPLEVKQVFDPVSIGLLQFALQEVMYRGTGRSIYGRLPSSLGLAGKTGTTNEQRDSWFAGMSGNYLAVAWLGRDDNGSTRLTGSSGALKIWGDFMRQASPTPYEPAWAADIELSWASSTSGRLTRRECPDSVRIAIDVRYQSLKKSSCLGERLHQWWKNR